MIWVLQLTLNKEVIMKCKIKDASTIANVWKMGVESLDPASYIKLERIIGQFCHNRNISFEQVGDEHKAISGLDEHYSDCPSNDAPAMLPAPCSCLSRAK